MFWTFLAFANVHVANLSCLTVQGWIKHSVAPLSRSAFWSTHFLLVRSWKETCIACFWAMYIEPELLRTAQARAVILRQPDNPYLLQRSTFCPWRVLWSSSDKHATHAVRDVVTGGESEATDLLSSSIWMVQVVQVRVFLLGQPRTRWPCFPHSKHRPVFRYFSCSLSFVALWITADISIV